MTNQEILIALADIQHVELFAVCFTIFMAINLVVMIFTSKYTNTREAITVPAIIILVPFAQLALLVVKMVAAIY